MHPTRFRHAGVYESGPASEFRRVSAQLGGVDVKAGPSRDTEAREDEVLRAWVDVKGLEPMTSRV